MHENISKIELDAKGYLFIKQNYSKLRVRSEFREAKLYTLNSRDIFIGNTQAFLK